MTDLTEAPEIERLFHTMVERGASDLHLTSGAVPYLRVDGDVCPVEDHSVLTLEQVNALVQAIMPDKNKAEFQEKWDTDFGYEVEGLGRFRANVFVDHSGTGAVFRSIPSKILTAEELNLPPAIRKLCYMSKGFVVVTGPTGSGKSTTLAAMIDLINKTRRDHLITIEDPIEFLHKPVKCLVHQREVHSHTKSFASALRAALREDPDIVLVGELRDLETIEIALETAETGHLVFGTLHTSTAASTVDRLVDKFPANQQNQIRTMLADSLRGVIAQTLCKRTMGGRAAALEVLLVTPAVSSLIRDGKTFQIPSAMQTGRGLGMQMLNDELFNLATSGVIQAREAYIKSVDKDDMSKRLCDAGLQSGAEQAVQDGASTGGDTNVRTLITHYRKLLKERPEDVEVLNNLAWILATTPDPSMRNGAEAVRHAETAYRVTQGRDPAVVDTLAAAYGETGAFDRAAAMAQHGIQCALEKGNEQLASDLQERLEEYQSKQDPPPPGKRRTQAA